MILDNSVLAPGTTVPPYTVFSGNPGLFCFVFVLVCFVCCYKSGLKQHKVVWSFSARVLIQVFVCFVIFNSTLCWKAAANI